MHTQQRRKNAPKEIAIVCSGALPKMPKANFQSIVPIIGHYVCIELIVFAQRLAYVLCTGLQMQWARIYVRADG